MLIPSEQCAEPPSGQVDRTGSARYRGNECRVNTRNESGTAEEIKAFVSYLGDKGFFRCAHESGNAGIRVDSWQL